MSSSSTSQRPAYVGRFAPSPTGELHQGSLLTAVASYLDARQHQGLWLVRMEDLDPPREQPGAADSILRSLEAHGLHWDGGVLFQNSRLQRYEEILENLKQRELTYPCDCNRARIQGLSGIYDGHCRTLKPKTPPFATRLKVTDSPIEFNDVFQGPQSQNLAQEVGDFVIHRKDGLFAYQLAVSIDDVEQGISHIIRGSDLLSSTPRQLWLIGLLQEKQESQQALLPKYGHIPVIVNKEGQKLSKQTFATPLDDACAADNLITALTRLGFDAAPQLKGLGCDEILHWGVQNWQRRRVPTGLSMDE